MYLSYGETEINYLKQKDKKLGEVIDQIGYVYREVDTDLFSSVIHQIIGQQISTAAQTTIWRRMKDNLGEVTAKKISESDTDSLQQVGISFRKVEYIKKFAQKVQKQDLDLNGLHQKSDEEVIAELCAIRGIGVWTAEMLLIFSMQRQNVVSFGDLAILRGIRMLYHHRKIDRSLFEKYRRRYSPYGTVASLYLWAVAGGAIEGMKDYAPVNRQEKPKKIK